MYQNKQYPFNEITWNKWNGDILNYWDWCAKKTTELGYIAKRILSFLQDFYILHVEIDLIMLETEDIAFHEDEENEMNINYDRINDDSIIEIANSIHPQ
ncbi:8305_t:CDS:2 [Entrophospora sp. SA101]|nr:8305_t:CDS:2 [Entrophospora sp. SA101]